MDVNEVIDGAIDYIQTNGWCQNDILKPDGSACMRGAMFFGAGAQLDNRGEFNMDTIDWPVFFDATRKVEEEIYKTTNSRLAVPDYNDFSTTSQEDALLTLKRAKEA